MIEIVYTQADECLAPHRHNAHELLYVCKGSVRLTVGNAAYTLCKGDAAFISNLEPHATEVLRAPYRRYFLTVTQQVLAMYASRPTLASIFRLRPDGFRHVLSLSQDGGHIEGLLQAMLGEQARRDGLTGDCLGHLLFLVLAAAYRAQPQAFPGHAQALSPRVDAAMAYLEAHFAQPLSIRGLADSLYVSAGWLSHAFRREVGVSPRRYLLLTRLSAARALLLSGDASVSEAALACGFADASSFIRCFAKAYGITPKQMQVRQRET